MDYYFRGICYNTHKEWKKRGRGLMEELKVLQSKLKAQLPDLELREQEPMRLHTTFRVGGPWRR